MSAAEKIDIFQPRRFQVPDLNTHGAWLLPRLEQSFGFTERVSATWLRSLIYSNESLFLYHPDAVGLAQVETVNTLAPKPMLRERFVWCRDRADKEQHKQAVQFYEMFAEWGKNLGAEIMLVEEMTDVPHELIKARLGRVFTREQKFARL